MTTDAERLRIALVNMLVNARHAVLAREESVAVSNGSGPPEAAASGPGTPGEARAAADAPRDAPVAAPSITLRTERRDGRVAIIIEDRGIGIDPADRARMFDPYFTTKRGGTGLGLPSPRTSSRGFAARLR